MIKARPNKWMKCPKCSGDVYSQKPLPIDRSHVFYIGRKP